MSNRVCICQYRPHTVECDLQNDLPRPGDAKPFMFDLKAKFLENKSDPPPLSRQVGGSHYQDLQIQPVEFIHANGIPYVEGAVIKYVCRWRRKNGVEDLRKAIHYLELLVELEGRRQ